VTGVSPRGKKENPAGLDWANCKRIGPRHDTDGGPYERARNLALAKKEDTELKLGERERKTAFKAAARKRDSQCSVVGICPYSEGEFEIDGNDVGGDHGGPRKNLQINWD